MSMFADDKYADRAWDWAKDMSHLTFPGWTDIYNKSMGAASGQMTPWSQSTWDYAQNAMEPYTGQNGGLDSAAYTNMEQLYSPWSQATDPFQSDLYKGASDLYQPTVDPLYDQLMPGLKRGIEGQYQNAANQALSTGVRGGALSDMLASAAMNRATGLGDMERNLRAQDISRLDQTQRERAAALTGVAQNVNQLQQAGMMNRAGALGQAGMQLNNQGLVANTYLANLLNQLNASDVDRAQNMANVGVQGRYLTGQNLAGSEAGSNAATTGGLMNMGAMLGLGLGGAFGGPAGAAAGTSLGSSLFDGLLGGGMFGGSIGDAGLFGVFGR